MESHFPGLAFPKDFDVALQSFRTEPKHPPSTATDLGEQGKMENYVIPQITFDAYFFTPVKEGLKHYRCLSIIDTLHIHQVEPQTPTVIWHIPF